MKVIGQAHSVVHSKGVVRVQSSMRVGTRYVLTNPSCICSHFKSPSFPLSLSTISDVRSGRTSTNNMCAICYLTRTDKKQTAKDKVKRVEDILAKETTTEGASS